VKNKLEMNLNSAYRINNLVTRCSWCGDDPIYVKYHDEEWGVPVHDDRQLFEMLNLEGAQAGLSWITVLKKRDNYRKLFDNFDAELIVNYKDVKLEKILRDPGIIRNRLKVYSLVTNAKAFLKIQDEYGSFDKYLWQFVDETPVVNKYLELSELPAKNHISDTMSKELKNKGFKFVGSTICYAFMQAVGMVNDHVINCFRYRELA
jgi:DNA-3-methyladenine glycosylase I